MSRELTWYEKAFVKTMRTFGSNTVGYFAIFDEEIIRQQGISGFMKWAKTTSDIYGEMEKAFGEEDAHLLSAFASFFNGCEYCSWGHLYAVGLLRFERTNQLYPVDEQEVLALMRQGDSVVMAELERRLATAEPKHWSLLKRQAELRNGASPSNDEDKLLLRSIALYEWVNECSIVAAAPAPPLDSIARKKDLLQRYEAARAPEREARKAKA